MAIFILGMARFLTLVLAAVVGPVANLTALKGSHKPGPLRNVNVLGSMLHGLTVVEGLSLVHALFARHLFDRLPAVASRVYADLASTAKTRVTQLRALVLPAGQKVVAHLTTAPAAVAGGVQASFGLGRLAAVAR